MVSSPEVSVGLLPPGFLYEREVEPVGRWALAFDADPDPEWLGNTDTVLWIWNYFFSDPDPTFQEILDPDPILDPT